MQIKSLEVSEIVLNKVDSKTQKLNLQINFSDGSCLPMEMTLEENFHLRIEFVKIIYASLSLLDLELLMSPLDFSLAYIGSYILI